MILPATPRLTTEPPEPGIYTGIPAPVYHAWRAASASLLKVLADPQHTPAHARAYMTIEREPTESLAFGSAYHAMVLEPERFATEYRVVPKMIRRGKEWDALVHAVGNAERILWEEDLAEMQAMLAALRAETYSRKLIAVGGACEVCCVWDDPTTGIRCKCRVDKLLPDPHNMMLDLKAVRSAFPPVFCAACGEYGYDIQAAFYAEGVKAATGRDCRYILVAQEKEPPYLSSLIDAHDDRCTPTGAECGTVKVRRALGTLAECIAADRWPGYGDKVYAMQLPARYVPQEVTYG